MWRIVAESQIKSNQSFTYAVTYTSYIRRPCGTMYTEHRASTEQGVRPNYSKSYDVLSCNRTSN